MLKIYEKKNQINIYKCCIISDYDKINVKLLKNEIRILFLKTMKILDQYLSIMSLVKYGF